MPFNPRSEYTIVNKEISIKDFYDYQDDFVTRPPYQRNAVWSKSKKQSLMDSLFRRYYIPRLVIREVRLTEHKTVNEVIDGQQRITTVQDFFSNKFTLPKSLSDISPELAGKFYKDLNSDIRKFIDKELKYQADVIKNIEEPNNVSHQIIATEIFWRLQQGETLNYMEIAHAQLSSLTRNFIVKYSDDQTFDYESYNPVNSNSDKHKFFKLLDVDNNRMKHLQYMARFILIEQGGGYADLSDKQIRDLINKSKDDINGIGNYSYEKELVAQKVLKNLNAFYKVFKDDSIKDESNGVKELKVEYFVISVYVLVRHISNHYVFDRGTQELLKNFIYDFYHRWQTYNPESDNDMNTFTNKRQQGENELEIRDRIMRQIFFEYVRDIGFEIKSKDNQRGFSELQRILIYRKGKGLCQQCLRDGKPESESKVTWSQYQADHVLPHSLGGQTKIENGELLCTYHNQSKGNKC